MSILGLTTNREPSFPRIGILRKGGEKSANRPGVDLKYFRFDTEDAQAEADFASAYGKEPTTINVYLAYPTPDENFQAWQEDYSAGGMVHRCDGEIMTMWQGQDGKYHTEPMPCPYHTGKKTRTVKEPGCKAVGRLTVIIPELRRFAYVTVGTGSLNDIMELTDNLNAVYAMRGSLQGIPFVLCRRPRFISTPKPDGGRARYEKWMLSLEVSPDWAALQLEGMRRQSLLPVGMKALTDGRTVDTATGEIEDFDEPQFISASDDFSALEDSESADSPAPWGLDDVKPLAFDEPTAASKEWAELPSVPAGQPSSGGAKAPQAAPQPRQQAKAPEAPPTTEDSAETVQRPDWKSPPEAHKWSIDNGFAKDTPNAVGTWSKVLKETFGKASIQPAQMQEAFDAFYVHQMEKLAAETVPA